MTVQAASKIKKKECVNMYGKNEVHKQYNQ